MRKGNQARNRSGGRNRERRGRCRDGRNDNIKENIGLHQ